jgi:hypothetical protein
MPRWFAAGLCLGGTVCLHVEECSGDRPESKVGHVVTSPVGVFVRFGSLFRRVVFVTVWLIIL